MHIQTEFLPADISKENDFSPRNPSVENLIKRSFSKTSPFWPLSNLIAVNPLSGFECLPFTEAMKEAQAFFQTKDLPIPMQNVNRECIKWLQSFFDYGQATIQMPLRDQGLLPCILTLLRYDTHIPESSLKTREWIESLAQDSSELVKSCLTFLKISLHDEELFLTLMLTTLPGWASHIHYLTNWDESTGHYPVTQADYMAFRLIITCLLWPNAKDLLTWHQIALHETNIEEVYTSVVADEETYQQILLKKLRAQRSPTKKSPRSKAQLVFCIDVRSEPFRRAIENKGAYETYGFAGFFGIPLSVENGVTGKRHNSSPVLLSPAHTVIASPHQDIDCLVRYHKRKTLIKQLYQSLKYTFITPFSVVETLGIASGLWMGLKSFFPGKATSLKEKAHGDSKDLNFTPCLSTIPLQQQAAYGMGALKMMGMTQSFAPLVLFCAHGSTTHNNAYATSLDCGACGGHAGGPNAMVLAQILNNRSIRDILKKQNILIPSDTHFVAAQHDTTTDQVTVYGEEVPTHLHHDMEGLVRQLETAGQENRISRGANMDMGQKRNKSSLAILNRSQDWSQVRPEWGLSKNASFIVAPRWFTQSLNLEGRAFLHSYEWTEDTGGESLGSILTAPMVVAQWINAQYLFSTLDNVAFGSGSKVTQNITGKMGIMQGNASDLMHGLPLQSVHQTDKRPYHQPLRLTVIVYAPPASLDHSISHHEILKTLFGNGWVHLFCHDPESGQQLRLNHNFEWEKVC